MSLTKNMIDEYMSTITEKCVDNYDKTKDINWLRWDKMNKLKNVSKKNKTENPNESNESSDTNEIMGIPNMNTYFVLLEMNYTLVQLKSFAKHHKLKATGTKKDIVTRLFTSLYFSSFAIKIQTRMRGYFTRLFNDKLHGPACFKRSLCVNETDFLSMEEIKKINPLHFFSYKDIDGFVYGFDVVSLYNLIEKSSAQNVLRNPYNRNEIPEVALKQFKKLIMVGKMLKLGIKLELEPFKQTQEESLRFKELDLFQHINSLGNYSEPIWFSSLDKYKLIRLMRELFDIWHYRLQITDQTKRTICPPYGMPFQHFSMHDLREETNIYKIKNMVLNVLIKLVTTGVDRENKCLGAYYVLGAITLVNDSAAQSLPWLFQSMCYN